MFVVFHCVCCFIVSAPGGSHLFNSWTPPAKLWVGHRREKQLLTRKIFSPFSIMMAGSEDKEKSLMQCILVKSLMIVFLMARSLVKAMAVRIVMLMNMAEMAIATHCC